MPTSCILTSPRVLHRYMFRNVHAHHNTRLLQYPWNSFASSTFNLRINSPAPFINGAMKVTKWPQTSCHLHRPATTKAANHLPQNIFYFLYIYLLQIHQLLPFVVIFIKLLQFFFPLCGEHLQCYLNQTHKERKQKITSKKNKRKFKSWRCKLKFWCYLLSGFYTSPLGCFRYSLIQTSQEYNTSIYFHRD